MVLLLHHCYPIRQFVVVTTVLYYVLLVLCVVEYQEKTAVIVKVHGFTSVAKHHRHRHPNRLNPPSSNNDDYRWHYSSPSSSTKSFVLCATNTPSKASTPSLDSTTGGGGGGVPSTDERTTLIQTAQRIDGTLQFTSSTSSSTPSSSTGIYAPSRWSNRLGTVLTPVAPKVYTADRPFYWNNIDVGGRMTVIQLPKQSSKEEDNENGDCDYDLWIHSPIELDESTKIAIDQLGTVKYVVSPNYEHLKYAEQWHEIYPDAYMWGCPGLMERLPNIQWEGEIPTNIGCSPPTTAATTQQQQLPNCWDFNEIRPLHLNFEVNPFTGRSFFNEVIFLHTPTGALMTTDLYWNYPQRSGIPFPNGSWELAPSVPSIPIGSRLWKFGMDKIYLPFYKTFMIRDRESYKNMVHTVLKEWSPDVIVPCHGDIIRGKDTVRSILSEHFGSS